MLNLEINPIFGLDNILTFKKGGEIHIKKKNRGKFTKSAKAAGESVQEHAAHVLSDPNATPLQKKRANFARNAARWKHENGGIIKAQLGAPLTEEQKKISWGKQVYPEIVSALDSIGVSRDYAPYVFAMSANESNWGQRSSGKFNYFGMKASKNQDGTVVTTHEGHGSGRVKIQDRFLNYSSVNDSINQAVRRLNDKFNAFSVPTNQFVMNLYQNRYYTNSPANYEDVVSGIVNGKLIKKILKETTLPKQKLPFTMDWNSIPQWNKKGGKVHKPFGHRSVLDNGWQSTKQLKNKKNVYGK